MISVGTQVERELDGLWFPAQVTGCKSGDRYDLLYLDDGNTEKDVGRAELRTAVHSGEKGAEATEEPPPAVAPRPVEASATPVLPTPTPVPAWQTLRPSPAPAPAPAPTKEDRAMEDAIAALANAGAVSARLDAAVSERSPFTLLQRCLFAPEIQWQPRGKRRILQGCQRDPLGIAPSPGAGPRLARRVRGAAPGLLPGGGPHERLGLRADGKCVPVPVH
jgi:hypothetical protein